MFSMFKYFRHKRIVKKALQTTFNSLGYSKKEIKTITKIYWLLKKFDKQGQIYYLFPNK